jgi:hypothetical protein
MYGAGPSADVKDIRRKAFAMAGIALLRLRESA